MRASYTAGFLNTLLENHIYFDYVAGISAGSSHSVNYLSRDIERARRSFVDLVLDPNFGGWKSFFKGEGYFRAQYIYEETPYPNAALPFDFETFMANPAKLRIGAFERNTGEMVYYSKNDIDDITDLMKIVRASSSMPIFMPPTYFGGHYYVDGGLSGGIPLEIAKKDGYQKFFVVLTRPQGYRKTQAKHKLPMKAYYRKYPRVAEAIFNRHIAYNQTLDELEQLAHEGKAFLVYPDQMPVSNRETNHKKLTDSYSFGYAQGQRDLPRWKEFLGV
ncbi:patatin family protein [Dehalobacter sp. DCM]|nr:patatin family protein [Dehalobacter sp. DCM]